ncbi:unnamed protein product [Rangifer tarandus platyrhynchus]|uniref:Uncharacterized protein n=2 Tax=Rangifer tarandus platyrhynchus TaxID=3082113 RepID=A0ABN8ZQ87_RANTA|nr:unnamed protein product [Rangifer tarandus platyrhynchus]CAI9707076.1 unnamed protein product [Rangifer tarandus platyrhynchus]
MRGQPPGRSPHPAGLVLTCSEAPTVCRPVEGADAEPRRPARWALGEHRRMERGRDSTLVGGPWQQEPDRLCSELLGHSPGEGGLPLSSGALAQLGLGGRRLRECGYKFRAYCVASGPQGASAVAQPSLGPGLGPDALGVGTPRLAVPLGLDVSAPVAADRTQGAPSVLCGLDVTTVVWGPALPPGGPCSMPSRALGAGETGWASRPCPHTAGPIGERVTAAGSNLAEEPVAKSPARRERAEVLGVRTVVLGGPGTKYTSGGESREMSFRPDEQSALQSLVEPGPLTCGRSLSAAPWPTRGRSAQPGATQGCLSVGCQAVSESWQERRAGAESDKALVDAAPARVSPPAGCYLPYEALSAQGQRQTETCARETPHKHAQAPRGGGWRGACFTDEEAGPPGTVVMAERQAPESRKDWKQALANPCGPDRRLVWDSAACGGPERVVSFLPEEPSSQSSGPFWAERRGPRGEWTRRKPASFPDPPPAETAPPAHSAGAPLGPFGGLQIKPPPQRPPATPGSAEGCETCVPSQSSPPPVSWPWRPRPQHSERRGSLLNQQSTGETMPCDFQVRVRRRFAALLPHGRARTSREPSAVRQSSSPESTPLGRMERSQLSSGHRRGAGGRGMPRAGLGESLTSGVQEAGLCYSGGSRGWGEDGQLAQRMSRRGHPWV